ncbi:hypothetical protein BBD46_18135 [Natrialba sp. SSL1]|nr:hypothetical protein BBD46_18135 [Natrialba sp. SSL1]
MANRDDVSRELAKCANCDSVYAARRWPDGDIQMIGSDGCPCGSTDFVLVDDGDDDGDRAAVNDADGDGDQAAIETEPGRESDGDDDPSPDRTTAE